MLRTIERLREVSQLCLAGEPLDEDLARWLGDRLRDFLDRRNGTIEEAFDLRVAQGGIPWWKEERIRKRDAALRDMAENFPADLSTSARTRRIHEMAVRYAASAWRFEGEREEMPAHYAGGLKEYLWRAFNSRAPMPIGERQLRNIIA